MVKKIVDVNKKIANVVVGGYKKIEKGVVKNYTKIEDKFVDQFLRKDDETIEAAKKRLKQEELERRKKSGKNIK